MGYGGYVRISRSVLELPVWEDAHDAELYFMLLLRASGNDYAGMKAGQLRSSILGVANTLGWGRNTAARHIDRLARMGLISAERVPGGMLFTVSRWQEVTAGTVRANAGRSGQPDAPPWYADAPEQCADASYQCADAPYRCMDAPQRSGGCTAAAHDQSYPYEERDYPFSVSRGMSPEREAEFETWWKLYPRKGGKSTARRLWMALNVPAGVLMKALENARYSPQWVRDGGRWIPSAAKWLDGRWEDYTDP